MAAAEFLSGYTSATVGKTDEVHTTAKNVVGTRAKGVTAPGNEYVYMKGVASTIVGSAVTYDTAYQTTLLAANAKGPVAFACAITVASTWGWYCIAGVCSADVVANSAASSTLGRETTDGKVGDGRAAGDQIANCFQGATATTTAAVVDVHIRYPFVDDFLGA